MSRGPRPWCMEAEGISILLRSGRLGTGARCGPYTVNKQGKKTGQNCTSL